jgi:2-C-methyl-D-erythritol 2,4-cyclodiphosphate synthase
MGWDIGNVDATVIAQAPRLAPYIAAMRANVATDLGCDPARISIKATTTERLGLTGREEGIAAQAVVLVTQRQTLSH